MTTPDKPWQPPETKLMGFWDKLGLKLRKRRFSREAEQGGDRARSVLEQQAREAGIPLRKGQLDK